MPPLKPDSRPPGSRHDCSLPQWALDKMARLRGRRFAFETIDPRRTALVVIDLLQSGVASTPCAAAIVEPTSRLAATLRRADGRVVWVTPASISPDDRRLEALWGRGLRDVTQEMPAAPAAPFSQAGGARPLRARLTHAGKKRSQRSGATR